MFETEDMLPRAAPKPSAPVPLGHTDQIVKPTVPEISILFGQPPQQQQQQQQQQPPAQVQQQSASVQRPPNSFAAWKKQVLPRVNFSPVLTTEVGPATPPSSAPAAINTAPSCGNDYNYLPRNRAFESDRTSPLSSVGNNLNRGYVVPGSAPYPRETLPGPAQYPRDTYVGDDLAHNTRLSNSNATTNDVLTICASTQTDPEVISSSKERRPELANSIDKNDIREVLTLLESMRKEQQQLRQLCESFALQQQEHQRQQQQQQRQQEQQQNEQNKAFSKTFKETGSQCVIISACKGNVGVKRFTPIVHDYIVEEEELPARPLPQFQSPRATPPMAQSTGYRTNTPQGRNSPVLPNKANTDKTMVMNELALKYLPQRQINELMEDLHVSPKTPNDMANPVTNGTPLRPMDNFTHSPSNLSNASYKYLKKYRLLPEEHLGYDQHHQKLLQKTPRSPITVQGQEPMLDLDNIRNQPKLL